METTLRTAVLDLKSHFVLLVVLMALVASLAFRVGVMVTPPNSLPQYVQIADISQYGFRGGFGE